MTIHHHAERRGAAAQPPAPLPQPRAGGELWVSLRKQGGRMGQSKNPAPLPAALV